MNTLHRSRSLSCIFTLLMLISFCAYISILKLTSMIQFVLQTNKANGVREIPCSSNTHFQLATAMNEHKCSA